MAIEKITMPQLGESVTEGTLERWLVNPGDIVNKYDPLAEVITDKVSAEIPSSFSGKVTQLLIDEGTTVAVGTAVCTIEIVRCEQKKIELPVIEAEKKTNNKDKRHLAHSEVKPQAAGQRYSPVVWRLAQEHNIHLENLVGTGSGGRVTRKDVLQYIESDNIQQQVHTHNDEGSLNRINSWKGEQQDLKSYELPKIDPGDYEIPVSNIRGKIAQNMSRSKHEIPHAWMMIEVDVTELVKYRNSMKQAFYDNEGFPLTYFPFFVKAVAQALKEFPIINSSWAEDKIIVHKDINLSIAVGVDDELYVPVIKHADEKTIKGIAKEIFELSQLARMKKLSVEHISGGTFTVNNTGSFGSIASSGIINYPQAAILQVESIVKNR